MLTCPSSCCLFSCNSTTECRCSPACLFLLPLKTLIAAPMIPQDPVFLEFLLERHIWIWWKSTLHQLILSFILSHHTKVTKTKIKLIIYGASLSHRSLSGAFYFVKTFDVMWLSYTNVSTSIFVFFPWILRFILPFNWSLIPRMKLSSCLSFQNGWKGGFFFLLELKSLKEYLPKTNTYSLPQVSQNSGNFRL